jgi:DNA polymerase-3 subunit delta'
VDAAEDLTVSSANALLKLVEEPPPRSVFLIVSHAPQRLLPTIRSRCRRLILRPLSEPNLTSVIRSFGPPWSEAGDDLVERAVALSEGSVRRAVAMLDADKIRLVEGLERSLDGLPRVDLKAVLALAESLAKKDSEAAYELLLDTVHRWVSRRLEAEAGAGPARLAPLVEVCDKIAARAREVDIFNLDRRPLVISLFEDLAQALRRAA